MADQKNLTLRVYERIKEMMLNYDIVPGQRLIFVDLAKQLGVSRTPVNNALSILAKEGYLDFFPNQGYSVHKLTREEGESLYEIREIFEVGTIGKAIQNATATQLQILRQKKSAYINAASGSVHRRLFALDTDFHATITEIADNPILVDRYRDISQRIYLRFKTEHLELNRIYEIAKEHDRLYDAIRIKDVEWAKRLIRQHNEKSRINLFPIIFKNEDAPHRISRTT